MRTNGARYRAGSAGEAPGRASAAFARKALTFRDELGENPETMADSAARSVREAQAALIKNDGVDPESARSAVAEALAKHGPDARKLYLAARRSLRLDFEVVPPAAKPPTRGGTRRDTPAAKRPRNR